MQREALNTVDLLEYAIYHWNIDGYGECDLPGIKNTGELDEEYFSSIKRQEKNENIGDMLNECFEEIVLPQQRSLLLCSGGVDSSTLAAKIEGKDIELLHTAYLSHADNDLDKLAGVITTHPIVSHIVSVSEDGYMQGLDILRKNKILQNTYGPTLAYALHASRDLLKSRKRLITGSGPDELFYGMEKYSWSMFSEMSGERIEDSLEAIDVAYNYKAIYSILNTKGLEVLAEVQRKRRTAYQTISRITDSIYDAQRLLAYLTVTKQHMHLFNRVGEAFGVVHLAPFLNQRLVKAAFSIPAEYLINPHDESRLVEVGKYHLKRYACNYYTNEHIFSRKIGFHAPTTSFMYSSSGESKIKELNLDATPDIYDKDKLRNLIRSRLDKKECTDYFLFGLLNLVGYCS